MLGQSISMLLPQVVGYKLVGRLGPLTTSTDVVLTITKVSVQPSTDTCAHIRPLIDVQQLSYALQPHAPLFCGVLDSRTDCYHCLHVILTYHFVTRHDLLIAY